MTQFINKRFSYLVRNKNNSSNNNRIKNLNKKNYTKIKNI